MGITKGWAIVTAAGLCLAGGAAVLAVEHAANYSWVDKNGERHYGDAVPPEYAQTERRVLNSQGIEVQHVDAQKNADQRAEQLKHDQTVQQRQQHDNFLLTTYTSTKDIGRLGAERPAQPDGQIKAADAYIESLDARLKTLQARALLFKPYNKKPDARGMRDDIADHLVHAG